MMSEEITSISAWEVVQQPEKFFPPDRAIIGQTRLSDDHMLILIEHSNQNSKSQAQQGTSSRIKSFVLYNKAKLKYSKIEYEKNNNVDILDKTWLGGCQMFFEENRLFICFKADASKLTLVECKLSSNFKSILSIEQKACESFSSSWLNGAIYYKQKIYLQTYENAEANLFSSNYKDRLLILDINTGKLEEQKMEGTKPPIRKNCCTVLHQNKMYLFGGEPILGDSSLTDIWALDLDRLTWREIKDQNLPFQRFSSQACLYRDKIYVFCGVSDVGGSPSTSNMVQRLFAYNIASNVWLKIEGDQNVLPPMNTTYTLISLKKRLFVFSKNKDIWSLSLAKFDDQAPYMDQSVKQRALFTRMRFTDITFIVEGEKIPAHKAILYSASTYFRNMFESGMKESSDKTIEFNDVKPKIFKAFLEYIYCGEVNLDEEIAWDMFIAADKYSVPGLKKNCSQFLMNNITLEKVFDLLDFAEKYEADDLRTAVIKFIAKNYEKVFENEGSMRIKHSTMLEICRMYCK